MGLNAQFISMNSARGIGSYTPIKIKIKIK